MIVHGEIVSMKKYDGYALITGGSSGLGLEFARQLAVAGYNLVLVAKDKAKLEAAASKLREQHSIDVVSIAADLSTRDSTQVILTALKAENIHVGILINNAGFIYVRHFHKMPLE